MSQEGVYEVITGIGDNRHNFQASVREYHSKNMQVDLILHKIRY